MDITINKTPNYTEVSLSGSLDAVTSPDAETKLMAAVNEAAAMVIDFAELSYISSAGLRVTSLMISKTAHRHKRPRTGAIHAL